MIPKQTKDVLNDTGKRLALTLPGFYGKVSFNIFNGKYVNSNVEQSIRPSNLNKGTETENGMGQP